MSEAWTETDPGAAYRAFDPDPATDAVAYRWTYFRPARPKLIAALSAVSGVDEGVLRPWIEANSFTSVIEAMQLDTVVDSMSDAWERLIVHDVVPDGAEWPTSWDEFATTAADLALLASDWSNVCTAEALAHEARERIESWQRERIERPVRLRWSNVAHWSEPASVFPREFSRLFSKLQWWFSEDEPRQVAFTTPVDRSVLALTDRLVASCIAAVGDRVFDSLIQHASSETLAALAFDAARNETSSDPSSAAAMASRLPDITQPLRAIRRLGYALVECTLDAQKRRVLTLAAPTFRWPRE